MIDHQIASSTTRLRWYQYRLRTLFVLMLVFSLPCSWLGMRIRKAQRQERALSILVGVSSSDFWTMQYDYQLDPSGGSIPNASPPVPPWLRRLFGDAFFFNVAMLSFREADFKEEQLACLADLPGLRQLAIVESHIDDADFKYVGRLKELEELQLSGTTVTDVGLQHVANLPNLRFLDLSKVKITGDGLKFLKALKNLRELDFTLSPVTDAGLEHLAEMSQLTEVDLSCTNVTEAGVNNLKKALPDCKVHSGF